MTATLTAFRRSHRAHGLVKLVDALDSSSERSAGSTPTTRTTAGANQKPGKLVSAVNAGAGATSGHPALERPSPTGSTLRASANAWRDRWAERGLTPLAPATAAPVQA